MGQTLLTGLVLGMLVIEEQDLFFLSSISIPVLILLLRTARRRGNNNKLLSQLFKHHLLGLPFFPFYFLSSLFFRILLQRIGRKIPSKCCFLVQEYGEERNLSPSLSLQWYFYQQVFHQFRL
jgi:hypothetical protein